MSSFKQTKDGTAVKNFILKNAAGMEVEISSYGGIITRLLVPDRHGKLADVVLGFSSLAEYEDDKAFHGALIGRYGNRIAKGQFSLNEKHYTLPLNSTTHAIDCHLHGGPDGFHQKVWQVNPVGKDDYDGLKLSLQSPDGEAGYPGNLSVTVHYWLCPDNALKIEYHATTDQATPVSLTNHSYFNLGGEGSGDVLMHQLQLKASHFTPVAPGMIPTGEQAETENTPFDFKNPKPIGSCIDKPHPQLQSAGGYDHNFVLETQPGKPSAIAQVIEPNSGRSMHVYTDAPGVQFYSGNFLDGSTTGKSGNPYNQHSGFCLETQHFPDAPNQPTFPTTVLEPGTNYQTTTIYKFGTI
ncbi:MAG: Aldose 1-epimerase [Opitutia bacterium UBA7350]|nr:MAG: Aldose 1-epimerase [Opitutae bacterium UBA7350]